MNKSLLLFAATVCIGLGVLIANPIASYGVPVSFAKGRDIAFADFTMRYLGERHVKSPVFKPGFTFYDFAVTSRGKTQTVSWTSGTGVIDATDFQVDGKPYALELRGSVARKGWLRDGEMVVWRQADFLKALEKRNAETRR
jgi:hypothetical protein